MRVAGWAGMNVLAGEIVGVFTHVEGADQDGACGFEPLDQARVTIGGRTLAVDLRSGQCGQSGDVEQILDCKRNSRQRPEPASGGPVLVESFGSSPRPIL